MFSHAAEALEDRHNAFFEEFRSGRLILKGFSEALDEKALPAEFVKRHDLYFDVIDGGIFLCETLARGRKFRLLLSCVEVSLPAETVRNLRKDLPKQRAKVVAALCKRGITSTSQLAQHSLTELAAKLAGEIEGWGTSAERVEALRKMLARLTEQDFAAFAEIAPPPASSAIKNNDANHAPSFMRVRG